MPQGMDIRRVRVPLEVSVEEAQTIASALGELPAKRVIALIEHVQAATVRAVRNAAQAFEDANRPPPPPPEPTVEKSFPTEERRPD